MKDLIAVNTARKAFKSNSVLIEHESSVHSKKRIICKHCNKAFKSYYHLIKHQIAFNLNGRDENQLSCSKCGKYFLSQTSLNLHIRTIHTNPRAFKCDKCDWGFAQKAQLQRHLEKKHPQS